MTNKIALWLALLLIALIAFDLYANEGNALLFLARKLLDLIEWMAFWR